MPFKQFYKTIHSPTLGVVGISDEAHAISPRAWYILQQLRCRNSIVSNFPGWVSILASGDLGGVGSFLKDFIRQNGSNELVAGGPTKLYKYVLSTQTLTDISGALSFGPTRDYPWDGTIYNDVMYLTNKINGLHKYTGSGNVSVIGTPGTDSPKGWFINNIRDHLMTFGDDSNGQRVRWADEASETDWTAGATDTAGQFDLIDTPDQATGLKHLHDDLIAYKSDNIYGISYVGGNEVFGRRRRVSDAGLIAPHAIAVRSDLHIGMGRHFFWAYDGGVQVDDSIGNNITDRVYQDLHPVYKNRSRALIIPETDEIIFAYPSSVSTAGADKAVVYNRKEGSWYGPFSIDATYFASAILGGSTIINDVTDIIDTVTSLIDDPAETTGTVLNLFTDSDGDIHSINESEMLANGGSITRIAESGDIFCGNELIDNYGRPASFPFGTVFRCSGVNIEFLDIGQLENIQFQIGSKMDLNDSISWSGNITINSTSTHSLFVPIMKTGRWFRLRLTLSGGARMKLVGYQFVVTPMGFR